ncbi:maleylpyruvate isomerase family mycothiol-dependent enzyme [Nonomuraea sp. NPDC050394]|uniref:maleylpyruvate isomerase family mycothiol-dependent enzyme n=1 Tax=Nonomuraea sp. NPDC050394 TaxID=3364363 RepID=UPI0037B816A2
MTDPYLFNGRSPDEHVAGCPECTAAIALVERPGHAQAPPARLRERVLSRARGRRQPATAEVAAVAVPYATQVALMDELLAELSVPQWDAPVPKHGTVRAMVEHLAANDARVAQFMGVRAREAPVHRRWREQAGALLERVAGGAHALLGVEVALAGTRPARGSLRQAMVQRAFETWTHAEDIRAAVGRPRGAPPAGEHLRQIVEFGLGMLPRALKGPRRHVSATFVLTGPGGGTWTVPLAEPSERVAVLLSAEAAGFCTLLAGRAREFPYAAEGDPGLARDLVAAAATLGCD